MVEYGSGFSLDENSDFQVSESGDVRADSAIAELHKDLAFNVRRALQYGEGIETPETVAQGGVLGQPLTQGVLTDVEIAVGKVVGRDGRIETVARVDAEVSDATNNEIVVEVQAIIDAETEQFEFVVQPS